MNKLPNPLPPPNTNNPRAWRDYWKAQGQSWRTEPEIDTNRMTYLTERLSIIPDLSGLAHLIYSPSYDKRKYSSINLNRADVEWLIAAHEDMYGLVDQNDGQGQERYGLDLRDCNLFKLDLRGLPLEWANFGGVHLEEANLIETNLKGANFIGAKLEVANLSRAHLERAVFSGASLSMTNLGGAHLEGANFIRAHLEGADLSGAHLEGADLSGAFFSNATDLRGIVPGSEKAGFFLVAGTHWSDVDLSVVNWLEVKVLGDELHARQQETNIGEMKDPSTRINEYRTAARANRHLAVTLH